MTIGVSEEKFWDSTPNELKPYRKADEIRRKQKDYDMWMMGAYVTNAVSVAVSNALAGKKSRAKYLDKPLSISEEIKKKNTPKDDFNKFAAWAVAYNEQFESKNRQG